MQNFQDKVAFVTGGASGIGAGMVEAFLEMGMKVAVADYNPAHLAAAKSAFAERPVHFVQVDVADREQLRAAVAETLAVFGKLHVLCNNAGVDGGGTADGPDFAAWDRAMAINLGGVVNGSKLVAPILRAQGEGGHIVNTASMAGMVALADVGAYSTAKYAVRGFSESLRMSLAPVGIGVSCLFPGMTRSALMNLPESDDAVPEGEPREFLRTLRVAAREAMEPLELGRQVVQAIRDNRFYVLTHAEFLDEVREKHRLIEASFPARQEVPAARAAFEATRAAMVRRLLALPAKD